VQGNQYNTGRDTIQAGGNVTQTGGDYVGGDKISGDIKGCPKNRTSGQIQGGIVNIDGDMTFHSEVTVTVNEMRQSLSPSEVNELEKQLKDLRTELEKVPSDRINDAKTVKRRVNELVAEADQEDPDKEEVEARAGKLKKAAKQIEDVLPAVLAIATRVIACISRSVGV
jgi:uncharacterized membrane protein